MQAKKYTALSKMRSAMEITIKERTEDISFEEIAKLVRKAYSVWDEKGYDYAARNYTAEDIERVSKGGTVLIALADGKAVGTLIYYLGRKYKDLGTVNSVHSHIAAVLPEYKGNRIGRMLFEKMFTDAKKAGCGEYVGDTCAENKKLLEWYKRMGCEVVSYTSFPNTSYYSVVFLKPLNNKYSKAFYISHRIKGWIKTHLLYNADGSYRLLARLLRKLKNI